MAKPRSRLPVRPQPPAAAANPHAATFVTAWLLLISIDLAFILFADALSARAGWELLALAPIACLSLLAGRGRRGLIALHAVALFVFGFLFLASWTAFLTTGVFLDRAALEFWAPHPLQVLHWVYPPLAAAVVLGASLIAALATAGVPAIGARLPRAQRKLAWPAAVAVAGVLLAVAVTGGEGGEGGPLLHAGSSWATPPSTPEQALDTPLGVSERDGLRVIRRPVIPLAGYLDRVRRPAMRSHNVLMVQIESLRSDQLRAYGGTRDVMPAVEAVAAEGRVFTNAYIQASHSNYADLVPLASQYPMRSERQDEYPENPSYPRVLVYEILHALGYRTALISSQNERWGGMLNFHRPDRLDKLFHAETFAGPTMAPYEDLGFAGWVRETGAAGSVDDRYTVDEAIAWLRQVDTEGRPFFLHMNLQASHLPYVIPPDFTPRFAPRTLDFPIVWGSIPRERIGVVKDRYSDSLAYEDAQLSRLFSALRASGQWDDTIVIIGGDNGEAFYDHDFTGHASTLYNEVMKVPMIVRVPGAAAARDARPAMFLDVPPSILDLLGLPPHPGFQGISLFAVAPRPERSLFMMVQTPLAEQVAIVRDGFKLLYSQNNSEFFLFDQVNDPGEQRNLARERPDLLRGLAGRLQVWLEEQLAYYADRSRQAREYAPVFED